MSAKLYRGGEFPVEAFRWQASYRKPLGPASAGPTSAGSASAGGSASPGDAATAAFDQQMEALRQEMATLRRESEARIEASRQEGFEDGRRAAAGENRAEQESMRRQLASSLSEAVRARRQLLEQADEDLVRLAVAIAEKVLNRQLQIDPDALRGVARAALDRIAGKEVQAVRMHPEDREAVEKELGSGERSVLRLLSDASLARGTLLFETEFGILDCSVSTQLEEIERGLTDRLRRSFR